MRLVADNLICERGGRRVISGLSFTLATGEAVQVTGANGAGKSSLLRLIAGLVPLAGGSLLLEGLGAEMTLPEQVHYCGHQDAFKPALTVRENLAFWTTWLGAGGIGLEAALERLDLLHLGELPAGYLSAGQKRRLALARLLTVKRPLWLLDEPTAALDAASQTRFAAVMAEHVAAGGLLLVATHQPLGIEARTLGIGA